MVEISPQPRGRQAQQWFQPMLDHGTTWFSDNVQTELSFLQTAEFEFPLSTNLAEFENSWVCSPWTHYVTCAREELTRYAPRWVDSISKPLWRGLGGWLQRAAFNQVVMVNNWLLSTVPWPQWDAVDLPQVLETIRQRWPEHAVVFRSLNAKESGPLIQALRETGALIIPSRQVWWFAPDNAAVAASRDFQKDVKLLHRGDLEIVRHDQLQPSDFQALRALYAQLYLQKYSQHNPRFSVEWLLHAHQAGLLHFTALRQGGEFVGVEAYAQHHGILTSPMVGYDLNQPQRLGLYRRLAVVPLLASRELGLPLNMSAGVGKFKALRGGEPVLEYMAVLANHLPASRQRPWRLIRWLSEHLLAPAVQRWKL